MRNEQMTLAVDEGSAAISQHRTFPSRLAPLDRRINKLVLGSARTIKRRATDVALILKKSESDARPSHSDSA